jgi:hypothetical protein
VALPIGALLGGWLATKIGDRIITFIGLLIAAFAYWLISQWPVDLLAARHDFGLFTLPAMDTDLALAGLGLGLVIGPLTSAALRVVPAAQHGIASSAVVVARMTGMLVGVAALSAWGLYRFNQILQEKLAAQPEPPKTENPFGALAAGAARVQKASIEAFAAQYGEIFGITAIVCVLGALLGLLISGRNEHADSDDPADPATEAVSAGQ